MPDLWFYGILNFLRNGRGWSNFRKIQAIDLKRCTNMLYRSRNFGFEFGQNRLKYSNFFRCKIFWEFSRKLSNLGKFRFLEWRYWLKFATKFCENWWRPLNLRRIWIFQFFYRNIKLKNSIYLRRFVCEEAKIKQHTLYHSVCKMRF